MIVIGVDTHKRSHTLVALDAATGATRGQLTIAASDDGTLDAVRFGRASVRGETGMYDHMWCAGDPGYSTPEQVYGFHLPDWDARRRSIDLYQLGSLLMFLLTGVNATAALVSHLDPAHRPPRFGYWGGTFDEVIVHLREATGRITDQFPTFTDPAIREGAISRYLELCEPDPRLRGHPKNRQRFGNPYSLERYVSHFNALSARSVRQAVLVTRG